MDQIGAVGFDAGGSDGLGEDGGATGNWNKLVKRSGKQRSSDKGKRTVPAQQNSSGSNTALLGNGHDRLGSEQRATGAAQRAVRGDVDALLVAEVDDLLLWQGGVVLDLVGGGDDGGLGQELLQVLDAVVGDADGLDLAGADELLHALPGRDVGVTVDDVPRAVGELGEDGVVAFALLVFCFVFHG